jgi:hypothetical protein
MKMFAYTAAAVILFSAVLPIFAAADAQDSAQKILNLNYAASGGHAWSRKATLELRFSYAGQGLHGEVDSLEDLRTGAFIDTQDIGPTHQANGFDGSDAWMEDISGAITPEAGGDKRQLGVNEAYRDSEEWWRKNRTGCVQAGRRSYL